MCSACEPAPMPDGYVVGPMFRLVHVAIDPAGIKPPLGYRYAPPGWTLLGEREIELMAEDRKGWVSQTAI